MITPKYRITLITDKDLVPTITALIIDRVDSYHVDVVEGEGPIKHKRASGYKHGERRWGLEAAKSIVAFMKPGKEYHYSELAPILKQHGISEASISPIISSMNAHKQVVRCAKGMYRLPDGKA